MADTISVDTSFNLETCFTSSFSRGVRLSLKIGCVHHRWSANGASVLPSAFRQVKAGLLPRIKKYLANSVTLACWP